MIRLIFLIGCLPSVAFADAWEVFEQRCLVPMEGKSLEVPRDLSRSVDPLYQDERVHAFDIEELEAVLLMTAENSVDRHFCSLVEVEFGNAPQLWAENALQSGRYEFLLSSNSSDPGVFRSTDWREPKIEVVLYALGNGDGPFFSVSEVHDER